MTQGIPDDSSGVDVESLTSISGVGTNKAEALIGAGVTSLDDVQSATQGELSDIEGIGNALAARIKADVGDKTSDAIDQHRMEFRQLQEGDHVVVWTTNGNRMSGRIYEKSAYTAENHMTDYVDGVISIYDYWKEGGEEPVGRDEPVVGIDSGSEYSFPVSQVAWVPRQITAIGDTEVDRLLDAGFHSKRDYAEATTHDLMEVKGISSKVADRIIEVASNPEMTETPEEQESECPGCDESFDPEDDAAVEGDGGELYCSLMCLNTEVNYG